MALSLINRLAALTGLGILLAGCCANNVCDCPNETNADAVRLAFDRNAFPDSIKFKLDTLLLTRYLHYEASKPPTPLPKPETVSLIRATAQAYDTLIINNAKPFGQLGSARLDAFSYVLRYYPNGTRKASRAVLFIDTVKLSGGFEGNGCCTCYTNSRKLALTRSGKDSLKAAPYTDLHQQRALIVVKP